ncbi:MAG: molybdopterin-dependent oxidoreductase, partial [Spirochaetaceae bacterium]|nr:molybdopterin-dependent oxidoreductase [Spirochaetaceae bacterium]
AEIESFNASHSMVKKGAAFLPLCFGISFTKLSLNQAGALVHVYTDGSVLISTGAVEMGQQVSRKIALVGARIFGLPAEKIRVERTSTLTVANTVPTAASTGADMNGMATKMACEEIRARLAAKAAEMLGANPDSIEFRDGTVLAGGCQTNLEWNALVAAANEARIDLSAHAFYATPNLQFDMKRQWGSPFAYHVYGTACVVANVDLVHCTYQLESASIVHDVGNSLDPAIDRGQIEGAFAQGLGWALLEDLQFGKDGRPLSDTLSTYKVPNADFLPESTQIEFLPGVENPAAPFNSKAIGEPPLQYGIAGYFAVLNALRAARPGGPAYYSAPLTPEKLENYLDGAI